MEVTELAKEKSAEGLSDKHIGLELNIKVHCGMYGEPRQH